jgi:hypothetical protein
MEATYLGWTSEEPWFNSWQRCEIFLFTKVPILALGPADFSVQWVLGTLSPRVKWLMCEAGQSLCSAEVKNGGAMPPLPRVPSWCKGKGKGHPITCQGKV